MDEEVNRDKTGETNTRSLSGRDRVGFSFRVFFYLAIFPTTLINACLLACLAGGRAETLLAGHWEHTTNELSMQVINYRECAQCECSYKLHPIHV